MNVLYGVFLVQFFAEYFEFQGQFQTEALSQGREALSIEAKGIILLTIKDTKDDYIRYATAFLWKPRILVTCANPFYGKGPADIDIHAERPKFLNIPISYDQIIIHSRYRNDNNDTVAPYDVAKIMLKKALNVNDFPTYEIVNKDYKFKPERAVAFGFGFNGTDFAPKLRICNVTLAAGKTLNKHYQKAYKKHGIPFNANQFLSLAKGKNGIQHQTEGDIGGPIISELTKEVIGIFAGSAARAADMITPLSLCNKFLMGLEGEEEEEVKEEVEVEEEKNPKSLVSRLYSRL